MTFIHACIIKIKTKKPQDCCCSIGERILRMNGSTENIKTVRHCNLKIINCDSFLYLHTLGIREMISLLRLGPVFAFVSCHFQSV